MLRRPPSRTASSAKAPEPAAETKFVSQVIENVETGEIRDDRLPDDLNRPGSHTIRIDVDPASDSVTINGVTMLKSDLPDFLFDDEVIEMEPVPAPDSWSEPFASGLAPSDRVMKHGRPTPAPIDNLPHSAMRRGSGRRSVR